MKLSIIIPVFNEEATIAKILKKVSAQKIDKVTKEIIVVNDGSTDSTGKILNKFKKIKIISYKKNKGKGFAVKTGIKNASGSYVIIQDADLEYDPKYINSLLKPILAKKALVVYGTRIRRMPHLHGEEKNIRFLIHYFGNRSLSLFTSVLYGQWITDMETGYKLFPRHALDKFKLNSKGFELEPEITAKLLKNHYKIMELPIKTNPRGYEDGKKLNTIRDGAKAFWYIFKYRFLN